MVPINMPDSCAGACAGECQCDCREWLCANMCSLFVSFNEMYVADGNIIGNSDSTGVLTTLF
jgi:hypothetical protein